MIDILLYKYLARIIDIVSIMLLAILVCVVFLGICFRYFLNLPLAWANELSQFLLVWLTFFAAAAATRRSKHLRIDDILNAFSPKKKRILHRLINIAICLFLFFMIIKGWSIAVAVWGSRSEALQISNGLLYLPLPIGFLLMIPYNIRNIVRGSEKGEAE